MMLSLLKMHKVYQKKWNLILVKLILVNKKRVKFAMPFLKNMKNCKNNVKQKKFFYCKFIQSIRK